MDRREFLAASVAVTVCGNAAAAAPLELDAIAAHCEKHGRCVAQWPTLRAGLDSLLWRCSRVSPERIWRADVTLAELKRVRRALFTLEKLPVYLRDEKNGAYLRLQRAWTECAVRRAIEAMERSGRAAT